MTCLKCFSEGFDGDTCEDCGYEAHSLEFETVTEHGYRHSVLRTPGGVVLFKKREHIEVAERALGKPLPEGAIVHHHDLNRSNNKNTNLVICQDRKYHAILHSRMGMVAKGADPNTERWCYACRKVKQKWEFVRDRRAWDGRARICRSCSAEDHRRRGA